MAKLRISDDWWTAPAEGDNGSLILVTGDSKGLPSYTDSKVMEEVTDAMNENLDRDPVAVLTGIYTGDGQRNWVFYTRSLHIFQRKFNEIMAPFPALPLQFEAEEDPDWQEYREMCQCEVAEGED